MGIVIDILLIVIAVAAVIAGYKNGFVKTVLAFARSIVAAIVAYAFTPYLSSVIYNGFMLGKIADGIEKTVGSLAKTSDGYNFAKLIEESPKVLTQMLEKYGITVESLGTHVDGMSETGESAVRSVAEFISAPIANTISNVLAFIVIFAVAFVVLLIVSKLIELVFKAPVLKTADHIGGIVLGAVNALVILWVISIVVSYGVTALGAVAPDWFGETVVDNTFILKFFSKLNPLQIIKTIIEG